MLQKKCLTTVAFDHNIYSRIVDALLENEQDDAKNAEAQDETGYWGKQAAGALIYARDTDKWLVIQRSDEVPEPGTWGTVGGACDGKEKPEETVRREIAEEVGYDGPLDLEKVYVYKDDGFRYHNHVGIVDEEFEPDCDSETADAKWVEFGDWPKPVHFGLKELLNNASDKLLEASS